MSDNSKKRACPLFFVAVAVAAGASEEQFEVLRKPRAFLCGFCEPGRQLVAVADDLSELLLKLDDPADGGHRHALVGHRGDLLDDPDLDPGVPALTAVRPLRRDDLELVDAAQERLLEREHLRDLADGEEWYVLVLEWLHASHLHE